MRTIYLKILNCMYTYNHYFLLGAIIVVGVILRIWGTWNIYNQDEYKEVIEALKVCAGKLNFERWGKRFYLYVLSVAYGFYYCIGFLFGEFKDPMDFAAKAVRNMDPLLFIGRMISTAFGSMTIFITYLIGNTLCGRSVGLIAAALVCLSPLLVEFSHYAMVDAALCFNVTLSFYFIAKIHTNKTEQLRYYILAGIFSGIAFQNKVPAVLLVIPFLVAYFNQVKYEYKRIYMYLLNKSLWYFGLSYMIGLVIGNPAVLFAPLKFINSLLGYTRVYSTPINLKVSENLGYIEYLEFFYKEFGILLFLLTTYGIIRAVLSRNKSDILILSLVVSFYFLMGGSRYMVFSRYMMPIIPFMFILAAKYFTDIIGSIKLQTKTKTAIIVSILLILSIQPLKRLAKYEVLVSGKDTKVLAKEWIEGNIPSGSKVLMDSGKLFNTTGPNIELSEYAIREMINKLENNDDYEGTSDATKAYLLKYYNMMLKTTPEITYDITSTKNGLVVKNINYYVHNNYRYFIITESIKKRSESELFKEEYSDVNKFYASLDTDHRLELLKTIGPTKKNRGHKYIIYKLSDQ